MKTSVRDREEKRVGKRVSLLNRKHTKVISDMDGFVEEKGTASKQPAEAGSELDVQEMLSQELKMHKIKQKK